MTQQNKELEQARKSMQQWNERRAANEKKAIEYFYILKEIFKAQKINK